MEVQLAMLHVASMVVDIGQKHVLVQEKNMQALMAGIFSHNWPPFTLCALYIHTWKIYSFAQLLCFLKDEMSDIYDPSVYW